MSKVVSDSNLVSFGKAFKARLSDVAISGSYNDLVDTPGDLQEYRQFTIFSPQAEGDTPDWPGDNDWKWYTNLDKLAPTSNPNGTWCGDWSTFASATGNTPIIWVAVATFKSSDGTKVSDWETYQATGSTGSRGAKGDTGNGISSVTKTSSAGLVDTYTITFTDGNTTTFTVTNGADGSDGADGQNGADGNDGSPGAPGKSAYQVAVDNGYSGTEAQWLASLKGETGTTGPQGVGIESIEFTAQASGGSADEYTITLTDGRTSTFDVHHGTNGTNGKSAYEVAVDNGFSGTETQWLESLVGATGNQGTEGNGISSITKTSTSGLVDTYRISYTNGTSSTFTVTNGANGTNGTNGTNGNDGNGISSITKTGTSGLVDTYRISYTNGTSSTFTVTNGSNGTNGTNGINGTNGEDGYYLDVDNPLITIPISSSGDAIQGILETCNINLYKGTTPCDIQALGINDATYSADNLVISTGLEITSHQTNGAYDYLTISVDENYKLASTQTYTIYLRENSSGYTGVFKLKLIPIIHLSESYSSGTIYEATDTSFTLSQLKHNSVLIADGGGDITFTLPAGDAEMDGRTIKIMVISGNLAVAVNSHATIITLGGSTADPATALFPATCVLEATYYWANGSDFIYLYQTTW